MLHFTDVFVLLSLLYQNLRIFYINIEEEKNLSELPRSCTDLLRLKRS